MYLFAKSGGIGSCKNEDINSYNNSFVDTFEKAELTASIRHAVRFLKLGIPFTIPKSRIRLVEKREEQHRQLQSVMRFTKTQKRIQTVKYTF